jgi:5-hydroxyisourate hydrolase
MGKITTHVLDTAKGRPAAGLRIEIYQGNQLLNSAETNADGRLNAPLLDAADLEIGVYEIRFHAGDYLRKTFEGLTEPLFLDVIPIKFGIADASQHYHIPLLLSPFGYSTYRGS